MTKAFIPPEFLLEWFLKSLLPYIAKDVSTSRVQNEDQAIFRAQKLDLIYALSRILYEIIPNDPRSNFNPKFKPGPHADGIVGSASTKPMDSVIKQVSQLYARVSYEFSPSYPVNGCTFSAIVEPER